MPYRYDIFISYRRNSETHAWITNHFMPLLELRVGMELARKPQIYLDDQLEVGTSWPASLGAALGSSRILIPLWSGNYLASAWCTTELSYMLAREQLAKARTQKHPTGLIVPAIIHDGEFDNLPPEIRSIQCMPIQKSFNVRMAHNGPRAEELDAILTTEAPAIANCINNAPQWQSKWPDGAARRFLKTLHRQAAVQNTVPRLAP